MGFNTIEQIHDILKGQQRKPRHANMHDTQRVYTAFTINETINETYKSRREGSWSILVVSDGQDRNITNITI